MSRRSRWLVAAAALASATPNTAAAQTLERRPYLQRVGSTEATIVWTTTEASDAVVHLGETAGAWSLTVTDERAATQHEVRVTGLEPDRTYDYEIGSSAAVLASGAQHRFRTAPAPGAPTKLRAWVVGDSGTGDPAQAAVRDAMLRHVGPSGLPQMFLHVGDMAYTAGTTEQFTSRFFAPYADVLTRVATFTAIGNHEGASSDSGAQSGPYYVAYVTPTAGELGGVPSGTEAYYGFDWGDVHFIVLDSHDSSRAPDGPMLTWMRADALANERTWLVAMWHHPPYTKGTHDSDDESQLVEMRENALPILEAAGVDLVLAGHSHIYERSFLIDGAYGTPTTATGHVRDAGDGKPLGNGPYVKPAGGSHDGAVYVVAGHGGAGLGGTADHPVMYFSEIAHGSCLLDVQGNRLSMRNVRSDGEVTDRFTIVKGTGLVLGTPDGGETLVPESSVELRWATVGTIAAVDLDFSADGGATWQPIASGLANTGSHLWAVPTAATDAGLVRVRSSSDGAVFDESNGPFTIAAAPIVAVPFGATWKYRDGGESPEIGWNEPEALDDDWPEGAAQLGYGDDDEATKLLDADPNVPTVFFRHHVTLDEVLAAASLDVIYDDGVAVYVNGVRVFAANVEDGDAFDAYASGASADDATGMATLAPELFVVGDNVIAAEVKQADATSSDLSFDLRLQVVPAPPPPPPPTSGAAGGTGAGPETPATSTSAGAPGASGARDVRDHEGAESGCDCHLAPRPMRAELLGAGVVAAIGVTIARRRRRPRTVNPTKKRPCSSEPTDEPRIR